MHFCKKYYQELTICAKQGMHISLIKSHDSNIVYDFHRIFLIDHILFYMRVHEIDPEIERDLGSKKMETTVLVDQPEKS